MGARPPPLFGLLVLGAGLLTLGGLLIAAGGERGGAAAQAQVLLRVEGDDPAPIFNGTVDVAAPEMTVLGTLMTASRVANFSVEVSGTSPNVSAVVAINGIGNQGGCVWAYELNGARAARPAGEQSVAAGDRILWMRACGA